MSGTQDPRRRGQRDGKRSVRQQCRRSRGETPCGLIQIEHVRHRDRQRVVEIERPDIENIFDCAHKIHGIVLGRNHRALFHIGAHDECDAAVGIDVVGAVLRIVFDHEDQRVVLVLAISDLLHQQSNGIVVIRLV